jgi:hypothetical protein
VAVTAADLNETVPSFMAKVLSFDERADGQLQARTDLPAATVRIAHSRDRSGMRRKDTVLNLPHTTVPDMVDLLRVPGTEPWYARGKTDEEQHQGILEHAEKVQAARARVEEIRGEGGVVDESAVVGGDRFNPITAGDVALTTAPPECAMESPAALLWHMVAEGRAPKPADAPFAFRGTPVETGAEKHARLIAERPPSRRKSGAHKPKHRTTYIFSDSTEKIVHE